jgi:hypothetical protein
MTGSESSGDDGNKRSGSARALRQQRVDELLRRCHQEVLQQIVGPFGLTPHMFDDKVGGNVTTQHNAEKDIFAKDSEEYKRKKDYSYSAAALGKSKEAMRAGTMNREEFVDAYTGKSESMHRVDADGQPVMNANGKTATNAELDHTVSMKQAHRQGGWMLTPEQRKALASDKNNLNFTTHKTNRVKNSKDPNEALSESNGFDQDRVKPIIEKAEAAVEEHMPTTGERMLYHGKELAKTGAQDAGKQALRRALGVLLQEFVNQSFVEVKRLVINRETIQNFLDEIARSLKAVGMRVVAKMRDVLNALVSGGVEGFIGNLITFLINNFITTAAKVVTLIRESMRSLWRAIKMMVSPPAHINAEDVPREVVKIITGVVTLGVGMMMEESIKGFVLSIPLLVPMADILAPALSGIVTGLATALLMFGIDRLFDAFAAKGTELLEAGVANGEAQALIADDLEQLLKEQFTSSKIYEQAVLEYERVMRQITSGRITLSLALSSAEETSDSGRVVTAIVQGQFDLKLRLQSDLDSVLLGDAVASIGARSE